jgi:predicted Rossmann fold flavoprotein
LKEIIIVGGGASGLMASIVAARRGKDVTIFEHKDKVGRKILATGNGRCNYTNQYTDISCFRSDNIDFVNDVLKRHSYRETIDFFMDLGIYPKNINGYIYPNSEQASSLRDVLELEAIHLGVNIFNNVKVDDITKVHDHFVVISNQGIYKAKKLILACGGRAYPKLGSDGSGYDLARSLGHRIIKPLPGLVQLRSKDKFFKIVDGVRTEAYIEVLVNDELVVSESGQIQFTKYGVSGIPILQVSRFVSRALNIHKKVTLVIDLLPQLDWKESMDLLEARVGISPYKTMEELFIGLFNNKLALCLLKRLNISKDMACNMLDKNTLIKLVNMIKYFDIKISDTNTFDQAQVTVGGVDTREVSSNTMESKLTKGLYLAGEVLDVDGTCGGYNLQWAWSSGYLAGCSV